MVITAQADMGGHSDFGYAGKDSFTSHQPSASHQKGDASRQLNPSKLDQSKDSGRPSSKSSRQPSARELKEELDEVNASLTHVIGRIQQKQVEKAQHMRQQMQAIQRTPIEEDSADKVSNTIESSKSERRRRREASKEEATDDIAIIRETLAEQDDEELTGGIVDLEKHDLPDLQGESPRSAASKGAGVKLLETNNPEVPVLDLHAVERILEESSGTAHQPSIK